MATGGQGDYVLGTHDEELNRLGFQHRVWAAQAFALWERAGFAPGHTILDVGCGPGYAAFDLASLVGPNGRVIAVDESPRFLEHLRRQQQHRGITNIETRHGDVQQLGLPDASVDGAFARWVLCFVKDPGAVLAGVADALRPGGALAVMDYINYSAFHVAPRSEVFDHVIRAVCQSWVGHGGDPDIGARLPGIMLTHGLAVREIAPLARVARPGSTLWNWPATFFRSFLPRLVEGGLLSPDEKTAFDQVWDERSRDPAAFLVTPPMVEIVAVKQ